MSVLQIPTRNRSDREKLGMNIPLAISMDITIIAWRDSLIYVQSKWLTQPVFHQELSFSSTPISYELVSDNGCKWSKDVYKASKSHSQMGDVIRPSRQMVDEIMEKSTIVHD